MQDELHRLVLNLMENALRHTDPGTAVEATVERSNGHVVLAVEDDGPGIPPELQDKVFERFFRAHGDRSGSSGLGPGDRARRGREPPRHGEARAAARRARRTLRRPLPSVGSRRQTSARSQAARAAADAVEDMSDITSQQLVVFSIGSEEYALPIGAVHEIIRYTEPRSVTSDVPWIRGVIGLRGKIIPIYDLASRMGLPVADADFGKIVIVETGTGQAGVLVGDVEEVLTVTSEQLEAVPTADTQTIESIAKIGDRLVILLNPEGLFSGARADELAPA